MKWLWSAIKTVLWWILYIIMLPVMAFIFIMAAWSNEQGIKGKK